MTMATATPPCLDMRGKTITTYIAYGAAQELAELAEGDTLELLTDTGDAIDNDIRAWCRATGQQVTARERTSAQSRYIITKGTTAPSGRRLAAVISDPGLEELLSPLGFALAAALEGIEVSLYFQGPAVRALAKGFTEKLRGWARPSAGSPERGSPRPGTSRRRRRSVNSRLLVPTSTSAGRRCSTSTSRRLTSRSVMSP